MWRKFTGTPQPKTSPFSRQDESGGKEQVRNPRSRSLLYKHLLVRGSHLRWLANTTGLALSTEPSAPRHGGGPDLPRNFNERQWKGRVFFFSYQPQKVKFFSLQCQTSEKTNWALKIAGVLPCERGSARSPIAEGCLQKAVSLCYPLVVTWIPCRCTERMKEDGKHQGEIFPWGHRLPSTLYQWVEHSGRATAGVPSTLYTN